MRGLFLMRPAHGHINPTIGLVNELLKKGHQITYICGEEFRDKFKNIDVKFIGFNNILNLDKSIKNRTLNMLEKNLAINEIELELAMKEQGNFDYVVVDPFIMPSEKLLKKFNIKKTITTITTFALNKDIFFDMEKSFEDNNDTIEKIMGKFEEIKLKYEEVGEKLGIKFFSNPLENLIGFDTDLKIVFTSRYFQPYEESFNNTYKFVGPSIFERVELEKFKLGNLDNRKLIYISLGTIANGNKEFYQKCFKALGDRNDLKVIISIGNTINTKELGVIPQNFEVYNYVPQLKILKQVDLFITHGGMNSTSEGLYNNIPLIIVPQFGDQALVAKRVEKLGAGIALINDVSIMSINEAVKKIFLDNSYKKNAEKLGNSLRKSGGYKEAARFIEDVLE